MDTMYLDTILDMPGVSEAHTRAEISLRKKRKKTMGIHECAKDDVDFAGHILKNAERVAG